MRVADSIVNLTKPRIDLWRLCNILSMAKKGRRAINEEQLAAIRMYENGLRSRNGITKAR